jgi:hypothetical protein
MKTTVYFSEFCDYFRQIRPDNFSYDGLRILYDYFDHDYLEDYRLDVIAISCDFAESDYQTIATDYSIELDPEMDEDYQKQQVIEHLEGEGVYVGDSINGIVYRQF